MLILSSLSLLAGTAGIGNEILSCRKSERGKMRCGWGRKLICQYYEKHQAAWRAFSVMPNLGGDVILDCCRSQLAKETLKTVAVAKMTAVHVSSRTPAAAAAAWLAWLILLRWGFWY
eukprot:g80531.t1